MPVMDYSKPSAHLLYICSLAIIMVSSHDCNPIELSYTGYGGRHLHIPRPTSNGAQLAHIAL
jgi:hypothetical protein